MKSKVLFLSVILFVGAIYAELPTDWKSVSSPNLGYTVQYPAEGWKAGRVYYNPNATENVIIEHVMFASNQGAFITVDAWKTSIPQDITFWLKIMAKQFGYEGYEIKEVIATEKELKAIYYLFLSEGQQVHNAHMIFFKYGEKVFRMSYLERDLGVALDIYRYMVKTFAFTDMGEALTEFVFDKSESRVYSCGGQSDTCTCNSYNPYPCCDNGSNCTWWGWHSACCNWGIGLPSPWRHAKYWATDLGGQGYPVSSTPAANTIACRDQGTYGHVAWVIAVSGSQVQVTEQNCCSGCAGYVITKWYDKSYFSGGFIYKK